MQVPSVKRANPVRRISVSDNSPASLKAEYPKFRDFDGKFLKAPTKSYLLNHLRNYPVPVNVSLRQVLRYNNDLGLMIRTLLAQNVDQKIIESQMIRYNLPETFRRLATTFSGKLKEAREQGLKEYSFGDAFADAQGRIVYIMFNMDDREGWVYIHVRDKFDRPIKGIPESAGIAKTIVEDALADGLTDKELFPNQIQFDWFVSDVPSHSPEEGSYHITRRFIVNMSKFEED